MHEYNNDEANFATSPNASASCSSSNRRQESEGAKSLRLKTVRHGFPRGWRFTPLNGKVPIQSGWTDAEPATLDQLQRFAELGNIGLVTGSKSGVVAIDDDTLEQIAVELLGLPRTITVRTGSDKHHYYFSAPATPLRNSTSKLAPGIDVRADGGQVVAAGSIHPETGKVYQWEEGLSPEEIDLAPLPEAILQHLQGPQPREGTSSAKRPKTSGTSNDLRAQRYAEAALGRAYNAVAETPEGSRNHTLNTEAFGLGRLVGGGMLDRGLAEEHLSEAAKAVGLPPREITTTLRSGLEAGMKSPFSVEDLRDTEGRNPSNPVEAGDCTRGTKTRPEIQVQGGLLPGIVDRAEKALIQGDGDPIYQREQLLVRVVRSASGILSIIPVETSYLVERLTAVARWFKVNKEGEVCYIDCPARIANTLLARIGRWTVPVLLGVVEAPTLRRDGSLLIEPGYDAASELYLDSQLLALPPIPDEPTREDAEQAAEVLRDLLKDFPWVADCDRAAALAAILTALVRKSLRTAPMFAFRAPKMGSGKSLLADVVARIATGRVAPVMSQGKDEEEDNKRILAVLMEGDSVACIDNVERPFGGAAYCSVLTQEIYKGRVLGASKTATVPTSVTWMATGNNLVFTGDITSRIVVCDLDPKSEHPEEREFDRDLHVYIGEHRGELVAAGLTLLRAYHVAGLPKQKLKRFGRFEQWSDLVRSALVWLGEEDPCKGRSRLAHVDPVQSQIRVLLHAWRAVFEDTALTAAEAVHQATSDEDPAERALHSALLDVASRDGQPDARRLGMWLQRHASRIEDGLFVVRVSEKQGTALWRVDRAQA